VRIEHSSNTMIKFILIFSFLLMIFHIMPSSDKEQLQFYEEDSVKFNH
jgi:hypothetical protein